MLLEVSGLTVKFGATEALSNMAFTLAPGERFGIVGESGSGKTLTALAITGLLPDGAQVMGSIKIDGVPLPRSEREMARLRGKRIGMVFQEPMTALNPLMRVNDQIEEAIRINSVASAPQIEVPNLLREVGLELRHGDRFAHQLSGGQRQRVMIAMALASQPDILIADEPTSALDLITQRRVLDLIAEICTRRHMALLFISHDLKAVAWLCSRVAVMHKGKLIETGRVQDVLGTPKQAYTRRLVAASRFDVRPVARPPIGETLLEVRGVSREYRQGGFGRSAASRCGRWMMSASASAPRNAWRWWGHRAAARPRWPRSSSGWTGRRAARSFSPASVIMAKTCPRRGGAISRWCSRIRSAASIRG